MDEPDDIPAGKHKYPQFSEIQDVISSSSYDGWCIECGEWTHDSCEPDAHHYECPVCGCNSCYGAEELLILNYFH